MKESIMKIDILPNYYLKDGGTFDKEKALNMCGKIAGVCYDREGFKHLENEPVEKTNRRIDMTLNNGHHSVYDHITINFNIQNIPKILAMLINNEHQYTTSEKSARYTPVEMVAGSFITEKEVCLYNKWLDIFKGKIKERYGHIHNDAKIQKLAQENARYLITIFMPTQMIYSTSLRQINYIASWMEKYIKESSCDNDFEENLIVSMKKFIGELERLNVLEEGLLRNEKDRGFSLIASNLEKREDYFDYIYDVTYKGSLAEVAHAHRHRTLDYKIQFLDKKEYFVPPIIAKDDQLLKSWLEDMESVKDVVPQGELVLINECGKYEDFILKCKERLCSAAQVEIMSQTRNNLLRYKETLEIKNHPLAKDIAKYCRGARCTFPGFKCSQDCGFKEGKTLEREV